MSEEIKQAVREAIDEKLGALFVEREQHYQDHQFIKGVRSGVGTVKKGSLWTFGVGLVGLFVYAFKAWIIGIFKGGG